MASSELQKRVITGVLGASALIGLILYGGWIGIYLLTFIMVLGMVYEFGMISFRQRDEKVYLLLLLAWFLVVADLVLDQLRVAPLVGTFFALSGYFLLTAKRVGTSGLASHFRDFALSVFGLLYVVVLTLYMPRIHELAHGEKWLILFFLIVWCNDTAAYFVGRKYGRRKLYPLISPKKTLEGAVGGVVAGMVVSLVFGVFFLPESWTALVIAPLLIGPAAQAGDLLESFFKRAFEVKDSGSILPGHGGFLDRFDGVVFALPLMYAVLRLFP